MHVLPTPDCNKLQVIILNRTQQISRHNFFFFFEYLNFSEINTLLTHVSYYNVFKQIVVMLVAPGHFGKRAIITNIITVRRTAEEENK